MCCRQNQKDLPDRSTWPHFSLDWLEELGTSLQVSCGPYKMIPSLKKDVVPPCATYTLYMIYHVHLSDFWYIYMIL